MGFPSPRANTPARRTMRPKASYDTTPTLVSLHYSNADPDRVYLTGFSMGGFGTWHLAVENPYAFAGIVPICHGPSISFPRHQ